ncbi:MAG: hypothetical protein ACRD4S_12705 [Candidatus Acidiferrales bacterium]
MAFRALSEDGVLESCPTETAQPEPPDTSRGVQKINSTVVLHHTVEDTPKNRELLAQEILGRYQWCPIGVDPKKTELGRQYKMSIREEAAAKSLPQRQAEARAVVALNHPELNTNSAAFNREVARVIAEVRSNSNFVRADAKSGGL